MNLKSRKSQSAVFLKTFAEFCSTLLDRYVHRPFTSSVGTLERVSARQLPEWLAEAEETARLVWGAFLLVGASFKQDINAPIMFALILDFTHSHCTYFSCAAYMGSTARLQVDAFDIH